LVTFKIASLVFPLKIGEKPYKVVKARPKWDRYTQKMVTDQPLDLFGDWQVKRGSDSTAIIFFLLFLLHFKMISHFA
jgi:hypothetical protein